MQAQSNPCDLLVCQCWVNVGGRERGLCGHLPPAKEDTWQRSLGQGAEGTDRVPVFQPGKEGLGELEAQAQGYTHTATKGWGPELGLVCWVVPKGIRRPNLSPFCKWTFVLSLSCLGEWRAGYDKVPPPI